MMAYEIANTYVSEASQHRETSEKHKKGRTVSFCVTTKRASRTHYGTQELQVYLNAYSLKVEKISFCNNPNGQSAKFAVTVLLQ